MTTVFTESALFATANTSATRRRNLRWSAPNAADGIHIWVDMKGYTRDSRFEIFAWHPAPIQVGYLGYPEADFIDYLISDGIVTPPAVADWFTEKLVILPEPGE